VADDFITKVDEWLQENNSHYGEHRKMGKLIELSIIQVRDEFFRQIDEKLRPFHHAGRNQFKPPLVSQTPFPTSES